MGRNNMHSAYDKCFDGSRGSSYSGNSSTSSKRNTEKVNHQYSDSIGGDSSNYKTPNK